MKIKYTIPGQNIKERTESSLLSRDFDERFMMFSPFNCMKDNPYGLEKLAEVRTNKKNSNDLKTQTTKEFSYLDLMKQAWKKTLLESDMKKELALVEQVQITGLTAGLAIFFKKFDKVNCFRESKSL